MVSKGEANDKPSRYMTFAEIAGHLRISVESVRDKALAPGSELVVVNVGNGTTRAQWRVVRSSFEDYCLRVEREAAARFGRAS